MPLFLKLHGNKKWQMIIKNNNDNNWCHVPLLSVCTYLEKNKSQPVNIICLSIEVFHEVNSYKEANAVMELGFLLGF